MLFYCNKNPELTLLSEAELCRPHCLPKSLKLRLNIGENDHNDNYNIKIGTNVVRKQALRTHQAKHQQS